MGCAPTVYTLGGQSYPSADDALTEQRVQMDIILSKVVTASTRYAGRAVLFVPSDSDIRARGIRRTGTSSAEIVTYVGSVNYRALAFFERLIAKGGLFESIERRDVVGLAKPEVAPGEHGIWARMVGPNQSGWKYFTADMAEPDSILRDNSLHSGGARYIDWLGRLAQVVQRNDGQASAAGAAGPRTAAPTESSNGPGAKSVGKIKRTLN